MPEPAPVIATVRFGVDINVIPPFRFQQSRSSGCFLERRSSRSRNGTLPAEHDEPLSLVADLITLVLDQHIKCHDTAISLGCRWLDGGDMLHHMDRVTYSNWPSKVPRHAQKRYGRAFLDP